MAMTSGKDLFSHTYHEYLKLEKLFECQDLSSNKMQSIAHDEHLFIITHQAYELWFKQIIYEIDSIREIFQITRMDESKTHLILRRLNRVSMILKLLVEQIHILETMTPLDFLEFRKGLGSASGFQSWQFRLIENKLGVADNLRIKYNSLDYKDVFTKGDKIAELIKKSTESPSLLALVQAWLERTPGLDKYGFDFWGKFKDAAGWYISDVYEKDMENAVNEDEKREASLTYESKKEVFSSLFDEEKYKEQVDSGCRRFSYRAFQGAMMIFLYRDEPRFNQPHQLLMQLMDIDNLLTVWRYNHVLLVQRMIGSKIGTGGSSGYHYLRSTVSDRYKVFLDLFNLATYIIPRSYIPPLNSAMKRTLSIFMREGKITNSLEVLSVSESSTGSQPDEDDENEPPRNGLMFY